MGHRKGDTALDRFRKVKAGFSSAANGIIVVFGA
jgi:hypothetical protein